MIAKDLQTAERLVNTLINEIIVHWASVPGGEIYMVRHAEQSDNTHIVIQPTHADTFYCLEDFIHVAEVCGCSLFMDCQENHNGILTPTLHIY